MQPNTKIKVLLAEDEPVLRRGIREQIERLDCDFLVTAEVDNGVQALEKIQKQTPDVLITDIKMPEMDGVELVRQVHLRHPKVKAVILSGYSDFSYTQQAIRYGVSRYLLKPVEDEDLQDVLQELKNELLTEQYQHKRTVIRSTNYREHGSSDMRHLLFSVCAGNLCYDVADPYMQKYYNGYAAMDWEKTMIGLLDGMLDWQVSDEEAPNQKLISCRILGGQPDPDQAAALLAQRISHHWPDVPVTVCFSRSAMRRDEVWMCSQRLRNLLHQCVIPGSSRILCLEEDEFSHCDELLAIVKLRINDQLRQSIEKNDEPQIRSELEMIFKYMVNHATPQRDMQKIITYIIRLWEFCGRQDGVSEDGGSGYKKIMRVLCCATDAKTLSDQLVLVLMQSFWPGGIAGNLAVQLVEYVDRHFIQLKQLESITEVFHYNYAYLSRLFKKQTGVSINKYVLEKRLNLAKQLIESNETLNIAQIAELSGFSDRRYFLRAFKTFTKQSPSEYKNSVLLKK